MVKAQKLKLRRPIPSQWQSPKLIINLLRVGAIFITMDQAHLHGSFMDLLVHQLHEDDSFTHTSLKVKKAVNYNKIDDTQAVFTI